ncbi:hypothetical protein CYMTET_45139 [Cymbomonas tetramitiformis]|uniref:Uncharacterized protein n=1 Tax=Cymbomonas tetramitiformis TaxID=36881 RepID=A0AAE0BYT7_9CHLO|nr:hypothetical protein CYMTET_45139 [Cymbomonas tetramitiformis]
MDGPIGMALGQVSTSNQWTTLSGLLPKVNKKLPVGSKPVAAREFAAFLESVPVAELREAGIWFHSFGPKYQPIVVTNLAYARARQAAASSGPTFRQKLQGEHSSLTLSRQGDELILKLFAKIERIENFIKSPRQGAAFSAACTQYGAPAVLNDGASAGGVDISAYGFATGESEDSDDEGMYVEIELKQLRSEVAAATGVSMVQGSFAPPVSAVVAATTANDALSFSYSAPSGEFAGGGAVIDSSTYTSG